jgi:hypothetical protein
MSVHRQQQPHSALRGALALAALLAGLACSTVSSLPFLAGGTPQPTVPPPTGTPQPTALPGEAEATAAVEDLERPMVIPDGPTIGTRRETRLAVDDRLPVLEMVAAEDYATEELTEVGRTFDFTLELPEDDALLWVYGWCATTPEIMSQNLEVMELEFSVNGTLVDPNRFEPFSDTSGDACAYFAAVVYDWPTGVSVLQTKVTFLEPLNDGFADYEAGEQTFVYTVTAP